MRIFEPLEQLELYDNERLIGVYVPGLRYNVWDDDSHKQLSATLEQWIREGKAKIIEEQAGTQPATLGAQGEVR